MTPDEVQRWNRPFRHCSLSKRTVFALALAAGITSAWSQQTLHEQAFASPQWRDFRETVMARHVSPVSDADLQKPCLQSVEVDASDALETAVVACLQAALKSLDSNSAYFTREERQQMQKEPNAFVGIGLEMREARGSNGEIEIVSALHGSPADKAGLLAGDRIISIADRPTLGVPLMVSVRSMRGEPGSVLDLGVRRPGSAEALRFSIKREPIRMQSVRGGLPAPGVLWLRLSQLRNETRRDVIAEVARLERQSAQPLAQVILDLRGCPGGLLDAVAAVAALWTPEGTPILRHVERAGPPGRLYRAIPLDYAKANVDQVADAADGPLHNLPLTILVSQRTGAGAEALAQVLRESRDARLFGQTTFGLAEVNTILPLQSGAAIRIATGRMESPNGFSWASRGVKPDVPLPTNTPANLEYGALPGDTELAAVLTAIGENGSNGPSARRRTADAR